MNDTVLIGLSGLVALRQELAVIANNVANIDTDGYKSSGALFSQYLSSNAVDQQGDPLAFVTNAGGWTDMSEGPIQHTGNALDVAIDGNGFFAVQTANGLRYTRNGAFQLNASGQIVTSAGDPVLGNGRPITLQPGDHQISINRDGIISVRQGNSTAETQRGQITLANFTNGQLQKDGKNYFAPVNNAQPQTTNSTVVQGALEKSNVSGVLEISRMIEVTRSYQQVAAMMKQQGDLDQSAIDKLAEVPTA